jgi:hypothetical protein
MTEAVFDRFQQLATAQPTLDPVTTTSTLIGTYRPTEGTRNCLEVSCSSMYHLPNKTRRDIGTAGGNCGKKTGSGEWDIFVTYIAVGSTSLNDFGYVRQGHEDTSL